MGNNESNKLDRIHAARIFWGRVDFFLTKQKKSLKDMADFVGVPYNTIISWRANLRLPDVISAIGIASFFETTVEYLTIGDFPSFSTAIRNLEDEMQLNIPELQEIASKLDETMAKISTGLTKKELKDLKKDPPAHQDK